MSKERPGFSGAMRTAMGALASSYSGVPTIAADAASSALKKMKNSAGRSFATSRADEERLKRRSRKLQNDLQKNMESSVKRKLNSMSGSQNNRKLGLKVAQFIPGKGLEVAGAQVENDPSIFCSLGLKGDKHVDPLDETFARIKGRQVSMDFAFKLVNPCDNLLNHDKDTRVTALNCFRHVNPDSFNYSKTGWWKDISSPTGFLFNLQVTDGGLYSSPKLSTVRVTADVTGGGGSGAILGIPQLVPNGTDPNSGDPAWSVASVSFISVGSGFTSVPTVTFYNGSNTVQLSEATGTVEVDFGDYTKAQSNYNWHSTLGPDGSLIRVGDGGASQGESTRAGTWRGQRNQVGYGTLDSSPDAASNSLISPYRYPRDMEIMYSRVNRQLMENYGWMLNPFKFLNPSYNATTNTFSAAPDPSSLRVWSNPKPELLDFLDTTATSDSKKNSYPAQVNIQTAAVVEGQATANASAGFEWHSQFGPGKLNYQFSNDGTNPVCIDICVVGIKKDSPIPVELMQSICDYNYAIHKFANKGSTNLNGFQSGDASTGHALDLTLGSKEWHKNAKLPFMPDACFKNPQSYIDAIGDIASTPEYQEIADYLNQGKNNPFKVVKRDQFIVSSGSSRAWNTTLPSINYRADLYDDVDYPYVAPDGLESPQKLVTTADEYTFVLCVGASGLPKPVEEVYSASKPVSLDGNNNPVDGVVDMKTIIDRQPSTCNVSVVGTYKETIYPTFPKDRTSVNFINGRLTEPYFETPPGYLVPSPNTPLAPRVNTVDISQLGQVVHTTPTGVIGVGAINTDVGA